MPDKTREYDNTSLLPILLFLVYTFSITWFFWSIIIIGNRYWDTLWYGDMLTWIPYTLGGLGPAIAAYIIYRQFCSDFGWVSFVRFVFGKKISAKIWIVFALFTIWRFLMIWIAFEVDKPITFLLIASLCINLPFMILLGGLEELGWRGILQPRLEKRISYIPAVLAVGTIWSIWHLPLWLISGTIQSVFPFGLYLLCGIILSFSLATLYKYTNNLFLCVLSHAWFNGCIGLALYVGSNGELLLDLNWKVIVVFMIELIVSIILALLYKKWKV